MWETIEEINTVVEGFMICTLFTLVHKHTLYRTCKLHYNTFTYLSNIFHNWLWFEKIPSWKHLTTNRSQVSTVAQNQVHRKGKWRSSIYLLMMKKMFSTTIKSDVDEIVETRPIVCVCKKSSLLKNIMAVELMGNTESKQDTQGNVMLQHISSTTNTLNDLKTGKPDPVEILECNNKSAEVCSSQASFSPLNFVVDV